MQGQVEVVLPLPLLTTFTYLIPDGVGPVEVGHRVLVPFGRRTTTGYVLGQASFVPENVEIKPVAAVMDDVPLLDAGLIDLARHMSLSYGCPLGEAVATLLPSGLIRQSKRRILPEHRSDLPEGVEQRAFIDRLRHSRTGLDFVTTVRRDPGLNAVIRSLEKAGFLRVETVLRAERAREKIAVTYALIGSSGDVRGSKQKRILDLIARDGGETPLSRLAEAGKNLSPALVSLARSGLIRRIVRRSDGSDLKDADFDKAPVTEPSPAQNRALTLIGSALERKSFSPFLLHGITGSGKTEVYLRAAALTVEAGRSVLALVPEIALTPQFVGRFRSRFGNRVALLHSARSQSERLTEWKRIRRGEARVVIGARSAVFAPATDIGLIVVDEEHDSSYKQGDGLPYHGREMAKHRARSDGAVLIMGSATPSLETYRSAETGGLKLLTLPERVTGQDLPSVRIVDLRDEFRRASDKALFSAELRDALTAVLSRGEQAVLFLNRRGFAPVVLCPVCGESLRCRDCSVSLVYHDAERAHMCHHCGVSLAADSPCPGCGQTKWVFLGVGTERVERELRYLFPDARIARMDRDSVSQKGGHADILRRMARREIDILIGTQMVTKGMDLPHVTLVGVLLAEQSLHFPDFRAAEQTFQILTQVVGRAGRGAAAGEAVIQTFQPEHYAVSAAASQDYEAFYRREIEYRRQLAYPPFTHLSLLELSGVCVDDVRVCAQWLGKQARSAVSERGVEVMGPAPAPIRQVNGRYRYHLLLRSPARSAASSMGRWLAEGCRGPLSDRGVAIRLDVDPYRFL